METLYNMDECFDLIGIKKNRLLISDITFETTKILKHFNIDGDQLIQLVDWFNYENRHSELLYFQSPKTIAICFVKVIPFGMYKLRQVKIDELLAD